MKTIPIFFTPRMVAASQSFSPSAEKPAEVVKAWRALGLPVTFYEPTAVTPEQLSLVHDAKFVREVLAGQQNNGFGTRSPEVAASLPYTTGAMLSAAWHALKNTGVAAAPCSGFHHAGWAAARDFCTFNGLMVTAAVLRKEGVRKIGILDFDHHYGDGTDETIARLKASDWVHHFTAGKTYSRVEHAEEFFTRLPEIFAGFSKCDVVLYQAGADAHLDDPLGGWLTTSQLRARDAAVFKFFKRAAVPIAWNLAGGYQRDKAGGIKPVLEIHENTLRECVAAFVGG